MKRWPFVALFVGLLLQVAAWVLVIPPYSTYDEFDHVFRASSVWHGHLAALHGNAPGYELAVVADRDLVDAGYSECHRLPYTVETQCRPGPRTSDGGVLAISGAAFYNPLYYVLIAPATALGHGAATVMWMRLWSVCVTASLLGWALTSALRWKHADAPVRGIMLAFSPMLAISLSLVAPNGLEMAAGLLWWISLVSLTSPRPPTGAKAWMPVAVSGCLLALLRSLGPAFVAVSLFVLLIWRPAAVRLLWRRSRGWFIATASAVTASLALSAGWILTQHAQTLDRVPLSPQTSAVDGIVRAAEYLPAMVMLFIGSIPARNFAPPMIAAALWLVAFVLLLVNVDRKERRGAASLLVLALAVLGFPVVFQGILMGSLGFFWQSRYILPLAVGVPLIAALLGRRHRARLVVNDVVLVIGSAVAHVTVLAFGWSWYGAHSPLVQAGHFPLVPGLVPFFLCLLGSGLCAIALWGTSTASSQSQDTDLGAQTAESDVTDVARHQDPFPVR